MSIVKPIPPPSADLPAESVGAARDDMQINEIITRLRRRYPPERIPAAELDRRVRGFYRQFGDARVRTFVAILVERLARRLIEA
jgi:hypothetical protein